MRARPKSLRRILVKQEFLRIMRTSLPSSSSSATPASAAATSPASAAAPSPPTEDANLDGLEYDFEESLGYWIVLASQAFQKALNEELTPHGITYRQSQVLGWLVLEGELSQGDLAARMMIEPATMVGVLDRMERDQWIRRVATPSDRRRKMIQLNARAAEVWSQVAVCARRVRAQAAQGLTPRQIAAFKKTIKLILANLRVDETVRPVEGQQ